MAEFPTYKEMGKKVAEEALDGYIYKGKTLREWIDIVAQAQWIPVSERLPDDGRYLCDYGDCIDFGQIHDGKWFVDGVIAWMSLPEPYTVESEG